MTGAEEHQAASPPSEGGEDRHPARFGFRPDIEGLRALAIAAVLLYHARFSYAPGGFVGVDMFFVISGFLITGLILREIEATRTVSLKSFYGRRMKRLLPATAVLLGSVVALSWVLFSPLHREGTSWDVVNAGVYAINWRFASQAVDYFAVGMQASPVQHFWSLAVEEQFYILWPALLLTSTWWWRHRRSAMSLRRSLGVALALLAISSFIYNIHITSEEAGAAYFSTFARGWEFTLGGALALIAAPTLRLTRTTTAILAWGGAAAVVWSVVNLSDATPFPGTAALIPTLGTAAIILAGFSEKSVAPIRVLELKPMRHVGRVSYSWYLWHWPLLVFAAALWGELSEPAAFAVVAVSYVPSLITHLWVEKPIHQHPALNRSALKALAVGVACTASSIGLGLLLLTSIPTVPAAEIPQANGHLFVRPGFVPNQATATSLSPAPLDAYDDRPEMHTDGCQLKFAEVEAPPCIYGNPLSSTTVVLFGDSHALQYFPALNALAEEHDWRLEGLTKAACSPAEFSQYSSSLKRVYRECAEWREMSIERFADDPPALIVLSGISTYGVLKDGVMLGRAEREPLIREGYVTTLTKLKATGAAVVLIRDGPHTDKDVPDCVSGSMDDLLACAIPRDIALGYTPVDAQAAREVEGVTLINPVPILCNEVRCPAVIRNILVYRNTSHLTATYVRTMAPWLDRLLPEISGG